MYAPTPTHTRTPSEFFDDVKGDALNGMEMSVALEKLNFLKLRYWGTLGGLGEGVSFGVWVFLGGVVADDRW